MRILIIAALLGACVQIDHDYTETYTHTIDTAVGPTTLTGIRTLPEPAPDDTNSIWVALNGADGNPGTQASPKLTIANAISSIVGQTNIQLFRNGYVGSLLWQETVLLLIPSGVSLQVEDGEIATIEVDRGSIGSGVLLSDGCAIDGVGVTNPFSGATSVLVGSGSANITVSNCFLYASGANESVNPANYITLGTSSGGTATVRNSFIVGFTRMNGDASCLNNLFLADPRARRMKTDTNAGRFDAAIRTDTSAGNSITITSEGNIMAGGYRFAFMDASGKTVQANQVTFESRDITFGNTHATLGIYLPSSSTYYTAATFNEFRYNSEPKLTEVYETGSTGSSDLTLTITGDGINTDLPRLLVDEIKGLDFQTLGMNAAQYFQMQIKGKDVIDGSGKYELTSPFYNAVTASEDAGPWQETVTGPTIAFTETTDLDIHYLATPTQLVRSSVYINPEQFSDLAGNTRAAFDSQRRRLVYTFGDGTNYMHTNELPKLINLGADTGVMRLFPIGPGSTLFRNPETNTPDAVSGFVSTHPDANFKYFTPTILSAVDMIKNNWAGWWILIDGDYFLIDSNDATAFVIQDKIGLTGLPANGNYAFAVDHILVTVELNDFQATQNRYSGFFNGGTLREAAQDVSLRDWLHGFTITFVEARDLFEAV